MADKKKVTVTTETKKPTGLSITRDGEKFTISWKIGDKNYNDGQQIYWRTNQTKKGQWNKLPCRTTTTSKAVMLDFDNYIPHSKKQLVRIRFKIRGNREEYKTETSKKETTHKCTWSDYAEKSFSIKKPKKPSVSASVSDDYPNSCSFHWSAPHSNSDHRPFEAVQWQSRLIKDCSITDGKKAFKKSTKAVSGTYRSGTGSASGTEPIMEDSGRVNGATPYARWFRVRSRGPGGSSKWAYARHVYARTNKVKNVEVKVTKNDNGYRCELSWTSTSTKSRPINQLLVQYWITTPGANMNVPSGDGWTDVMTLKPKDGTDRAVFIVSDVIDVDQAIYFRINTQHDQNITPGDPVLGRVGSLTAPDLTSVVPVEETHRATVTAANNSSVPGAFLAVIYKDSATPSQELIIGIIGPGGSSTIVQAPDWGTNEKSFGVRAYVGTYTAQTRADGVTIYAVNAYENKELMSSVKVWDNGSVPPAPTGVTVSATNTPGTVRVTWDNPWTEADGAELSWANHSDAWTSTDPPQNYIVSSAYASEWNIVNLEVGQVWYIRVRLIKGSGDDATPGPWSEIAQLSLASAPSIPTLTLSQAIIPADGIVTASWGYSSTDGTPQVYAEICEAEIDEETGIITYGDPKWTTQTAQHIDINASEAEWATGSTYNLCVRVVSGSGQASDGWSDPVPIMIAEPLTAIITGTSLVEETIEDNPREFAGEVVTFENTSEAGVATSLIADIDAEQDLNGYESPWIHDDNENTPYLFRPSDTVAEVGNRIYDSVVGGTLAVNQMFNFEIQVPATGTVNGITFTKGDEILTVSGTATADAYRSSVHQVIAGHKYFNKSCPQGGSASTYMAYMTGQGIPFNATSQDTGNGVIVSPSSSGNSTYVYALVKNGATVNNLVFRPQVVDITQLCGSATADYVYNLEQSTAGSGVAWLKQYYPSIFNSYQPYNAGTLESVEASEHITVGRNIWGGIKMANDIKAEIPQAVLDTDAKTVSYASGYALETVNFTGNIIFKQNTAYTLILKFSNTKARTNMRVVYKDGTWQFIPTSVTGLQTIVYTTNASKTIDYIGALNSDGTSVFYYEECGIFEGTKTADEFEPYVSHSYPLDSTLTLRGIPKLNNGVPYYDGDEYKSDGSVTRRYGIVDLGTLTWNTQANNNYTNFYSSGISSLIQYNASTPNIICAVYKSEANNTASPTDDNYIWINANKQIRIKDTSKATLTNAQFQSAMSGVYLVYELATPTTETADPYTNPQVVYADGTEEYITNNVVPVGHVTDHANICPITGHDTVNVVVSPTTTGGTTYSTALGSTVYGGTLDIVSGELTITHISKTYNGTESWLASAQTNAAYFVLWNQDPSKSNTDTTQKANWLIGGGNSYQTFGYYRAQADGGVCVGNRIGTTDYKWADATEFKAYLSENPLQIVYELATPTTTTLTAQQVQLLLGANNIWADTGDVSVRVVDSARNVTSLKDMPLTITVTGAGETGETTVAIERAESYYLDRPDERDFTGHEGETVALFSQIGEAQISIDNEDLIGSLDDGAQYRIVATVSDGIGQSAEAEQEFEVHWSHQAIEPTATIEIDNENLIAKITPIAPAEAEQGDTCDIYRLSVDRPELIFEGAEFGTMYVDPFPALGEMGGHRIVFRTANGDYITEDNTIAWADYTQEETGGVNTMYNIIDFDGNQVRLMYDITLDAGWEKDFTATKYLGGHIQGDWNAAVVRSGSVGGSLIVTQDQETIQNLRRLADYPGICHVRTRDGSSYAADVQVSEARDMGKDVIRSEFTLTITRVDPEGFDGMTYADWVTSVNE